MLGDGIGGLFGGRKGVRSFSEAMEGFRTLVTDLQGIISKEKETIVDLTAEKQEIDEKISVAKTEVANCEQAISSITGMFPGIKVDN